MEKEKAELLTKHSASILVLPPPAYIPLPTVTIVPSKMEAIKFKIKQVSELLINRPE